MTENELTANERAELSLNDVFEYLHPSADWVDGAWRVGPVMYIIPVREEFSLVCRNPGSDITVELRELDAHAVRCLVSNHRVRRAEAGELAWQWRTR